MRNILIVLIVFILMEPFTTFIHRYVMHLFGWVWHKSHHTRFAKPFELNDLYPVVFSFLTIYLFVLGMENSIYTAVGIGITLYGIVYFIVHEIIIHSRFIAIKNNNRLFNYWRFGHNVHHQFQKAPYGFIIPVTPKVLRIKAVENYRDLLNRFHNNKDIAN